MSTNEELITLTLTPTEVCCVGVAVSTTGMLQEAGLLKALDLIEGRLGTPMISDPDYHQLTDGDSKRLLDINNRLKKIYDEHQEAQRNG